MFNVGDFVKVKTIPGVLRQCTGNDYRYKITKVHDFLGIRSYDLCTSYIGPVVTHEKVPEKHLAKWWEIL